MTIHTDNLTPYLDSFSLSDLQARIRDYRRLALDKLSDHAAREALWKILAPSQHAAYVPLIGNYAADTTFWRARALKSDDHYIPLRDMKGSSDAWEPPADRISVRGRLNLAGESLLYTCPEDARLAIREARIFENSWFCLIKYKALVPINVVLIMAGDTSDWGLNEIQRSKYDMLMDFFETEFTREVGEGNEHQYRTSEIIAKDHFDLPPEIQDAWLYPSTVGKPLANVAFRPSVAHEKLRLEGVALSKWNKAGDAISLEGYAFTDGTLNNQGEFVWWPVGSTPQEERFPEFGTPR